jgi:hypothetical protein
MSKRFLLVVALIAASPRALRAQYSDEADSSNTRNPIAGWVALGLGSGHLRGGNGGLFTSVTRANVSVGPWLLTHRESDAGPFMDAGKGVREDALLLGMRTNWRRIFASGALGYGRASSYHQCDQCGMTRVDPRVGTFAYDVGIHANLVVPGIYASISGSTGPSAVSYSAFTVGLELGWFGR